MFYSYNLWCLDVLNWFIEIHAVVCTNFHFLVKVIYHVSFVFIFCTSCSCLVFMVSRRDKNSMLDNLSLLQILERTHRWWSLITYVLFFLNSSSVLLWKIIVYGHNIWYDLWLVLQIHLFITLYSCFCYKYSSFSLCYWSILKSFIVDNVCISSLRIILCFHLISWSIINLQIFFLLFFFLIMLSFSLLSPVFFDARCICWSWW